MADKLDLTAYSLPHLHITRFAQAQPYTPITNVRSRPDGRDPAVHGKKLGGELRHSLAQARQMFANRDDAIAEGTPGVYVEIASQVDKTLPDKGWEQKGLRIGAVHLDDTGAQVGGLFVSTQAEQFLADTIAQYTAGTGGKSAAVRLEKIERIEPATVQTLWVDNRPLPEAGQRIWWECWCWREKVNNLRRPAERLGLSVSEQKLVFPDFEVVPVYGTREDIERLLYHTDAVEELRNASDTPHVYTYDLAEYHVPLLRDLVGRVTPAGDEAPAACILDTGVARAHPLLAPSLAQDDCHAVDENWRTDDHYRNGHGTQMAGMALFGDLTYFVGDERQVALAHRLESVKLLPPDRFPPNEPASLGFVTQSAISLPEGEAPERSRVFCMAVTNKGLSGERPTTWSAALDQAAAGVMRGEADQADAPKRLIVVSSGNIPDAATAAEVDDSALFPMEDPAQAWNVLTVGGFTDRNQLVHELYADWTAYAQVGDRSPYSRMSKAWREGGPIKPEVVFEAGNRALSPNGADLVAGVESLSVLTTNKDFIDDPLAPFFATSAATGEAARMAVMIAAEHPDYWPETVRALMVHSARWKPAMLDRMKAAKGKKATHIELAREFGYGVPSLDRALTSARSDLALVSQAKIQPFIRGVKEGDHGREVWAGAPKFHNAHIYELPWPKTTLEELGEERVELKVTLSYFVEPSPGRYAPVTPARYRSHGFRFDLQRRTENPLTFLQRINKQAAVEDDDEQLDEAVVIEPEADAGWTFGANSRASRAAGSLHCDIWRGSGADLASRQTLAVYPVAGWWKHRVPQKRYNSNARYALVMTLRCLGREVDLYSDIEAEIARRIAPKVSV